jgi:hypothetical protein
MYSLFDYFNLFLLLFQYHYVFDTFKLNGPAPTPTPPPSEPAGKPTPAPGTCSAVYGQVTS